VPRLLAAVLVLPVAHWWPTPSGAASLVAVQRGTAPLASQLARRR
jgi:hypothetical protein